MNRMRMGVLAAAGVVALTAGTDLRPADAGAPAVTELRMSARRDPPARHARVPLAFEENRGQTDERVRFVARASGITAFITSTETVLALHAQRAEADGGGIATEVVRMRLVGASESPAVAGTGHLPGKCNYFLGSDPSKWVTGVPTFEGAVVRDAYPGVDVHWRGDAERRLAYDLVVAPGTDVATVAIALEGARDLAIDADGSLRASTDLGELRQSRPVAFQTVDGERRPVEAAFAVTPDGHVRFDVGAYDTARPLVIDPSVTYSSHLGGSGIDQSGGIAVDASGAAYLAGRTTSSNFPTQAPFDSALGGTEDAYVTKVDPTGTSVVYSTYLGGSSTDYANAIAVDASGAAYVGGRAQSTDFPTQSPIQTSGGGFLTKLAASGSSLAYSTYVGGVGGVVLGIAVDSGGAAYLAASPITKIDAAGSAIAWTMSLGGTAYDVAVDASGAVCVVGYTNSTGFTTVSPMQASLGGGMDAFVAKIDATGTAPVYSTYLGGSASEYGLGIAVDSAGAVYVAGWSASTDFPTTPSSFQPTYVPGGTSGTNGFVAKLSSSGALVYSTYLGGTADDSAIDIAVDSGGEAVVVGNVSSSDFPLFAPAQATLGGGNADAFVTELDASGSGLVFSTYLGGSGSDPARGVVVDATGAAYVCGSTTSSTFPTQSPFQGSYGGGNYDAFVAKYPLTNGSGGGAPTPPPAAPTGLVAINEEGGRVVLTWNDNSTDETGFRIEKKPAGYSFAHVATTGANATTSTDGGLNPSTTYTYRVRAFNANGSSAWSNEASVTTPIDGVPIPAPPRAPSRLEATADADGANWLSWTDNSADEVLFQLERSVGGAAFRSLVALKTDVTGFVDYEVHPGWPCAYRVRALALQGPSPYSNVATATLPSTLDVTVVSGKLKDRKQPRGDTLELSAAFAFPSASGTAAALDPEAGGLELQLGPANAPIRVSIAPGDATWEVTKKTKARKGRPSVATVRTWKSPKGESPTVTVVVNLVRHTLKATVTGADFAAAPTTDVRLLVACGADGGAHAATWRERKPGALTSK